MDSEQQDWSSDMGFTWYAYGHDFGNTETNDVLLKNGKAIKDDAPTAFVRVDKNAMRNLGIEVDKNSAFVHQFEEEAHAYAFGDLALQQGVEVWTGRGDEKRYTSKFSVRALLTLSASMIPDKEYGLYVVTGLPADYFIKYPDLRKEIKRALDGKYCFTIDSGKTWRTVTVEIASVIMEGAGALMAYGGSQQANKATESGVIDIGGGTTDLYAQRGGVPMPEFCKAKRVAVEAATQFVKDVFEQENPRRPLTDLEAREIMFAFASKKKSAYPLISSYGKVKDAKELEHLAKQAVEQVAGEIETFVASTWRQAGGGARFNPVLLIGGGFYYFHDALKARIPHLQAPDDPTFANALGYAKFAESLLPKKLEKEAAKAAKAIRAVEQQQQAGA